jgi:hypothetical protein
VRFSKITAASNQFGKQVVSPFSLGLLHCADCGLSKDADRFFTAGGAFGQTAAAPRMERAAKPVAPQRHGTPVQPELAPNKKV